MMRSGRSCAHCHTLNYPGGGTWPYCSRCGHRADVARLQCDCMACIRAVVPDLLEIDDSDYSEEGAQRLEGGAS